MSKETLLTVLLITYNHQRFFKESIESVLAQETDFNFKIHVLDDASTDGTSDLVREYAKKYPDKVIPFIRKNNVGCVENIYQGIKNVKTKYFATMETDDYWCDKNKLQTQVDILEKNLDCSFCGHNTSFNYVDNPAHPNQGNTLYNVKTQKISFPKRFKSKKFIKVHISSRVFRTSCLELDKLKNKDIISWDSTNYWWMLSKGKCFYIAKVMSVYNVNGNSLYSGAGAKKQIMMAVKNIVAINKEFDYKYNKIFIDILKPYRLIKKLEYLKMKYLTGRKKLDYRYHKILLDLYPINFFAAVGHNNLGDVLNYHIVRKINPYYVEASARECNFVAIGSILDLCFFMKKHKKRHYANKVHVWGSGFISEWEGMQEHNPSLKEEFASKMEIHALRGELSKERCEKLLNKNLDNIVLGDPGLLTNRLIEYSKIEKKYDVGIIAHYVDKGSKHFENIKLEDHSTKIIDVSGDTLETLKQIAQCKVILSSAMHGLIVADSFNIPNQWIEFSDNVLGRGYKFKDYYSVFNIKNPKSIDLRTEVITDKDIDKIKQSYTITKEQVDKICDDLLEVFPKELREVE